MFDPDKTYYQSSPIHPGPYTPRQISTAPDKKISVMYKDADGMSNGELEIKVVWVDDVALYLERSPEDDFMIPWSDVFYIQIEGLD